MLTLKEFTSSGAVSIDGGPENANCEFYATAALLVAFGLVEQVVITPQHAGSSHEDNDGCSALNWRRIRDECTDIYYFI